MKHFIWGAFLSFCFVTSTSAQDIIITKEAKKIEAKIVNVNKSTVDYKEFGNADGETKTMLKSNIASISYENGTVEVYNSSDKQSADNTSPRKAYQPLTCSDMEVATVKGNKIFYNDRALSRKEIYYAMQNCCPDAFKTYNSGKHTMIAGIATTSAGLGVCGIGGLVMLLSIPLCDDDDLEGDWDVDKDIFRAGLGISIVGATATCVGVPLWIAGAHKKNKGYNQFKDNCVGKTSSYNEPIHLDLISRKNSMGLALKF